MIDLQLILPAMKISSHDPVDDAHAFQFDGVRVLFSRCYY